MIFTAYLQHLKKLDDMELELYKLNPNPTIMYTENAPDQELKDRIKLMDEQRRLIIMQMAKAIGIPEAKYHCPKCENLGYLRPGGAFCSSGCAIAYAESGQFRKYE